MTRAPALAETPVAPEARAFEFMLNALRLVDGVSLALMAERTGLTAEAVEPTLRDAEARGLIDEVTPGFWRPSALGRQFLNDLQAAFLT